MPAAMAYLGLHVLALVLPARVVRGGPGISLFLHMFDSMHMTVYTCQNFKASFNFEQTEM